MRTKLYEYIKKMYHKFMDYNIRKKLLIMNTMVILVMTVLLGGTGYLFVKNLITEKSQTSSMNLVEQIGDNFDSSITSAADAVFQQYFNSNLAEYLAKVELGRQEKYALNREISNFSYNLMNYNTDIEVVAVSDSSHILYYTAQDGFEEEKSMMEKSIPFKKVLEMRGKIYMHSYDERIFLISRAIVDKSTMECVGVLTVAMNVDYLKEQYRNAIEDGANTLILLNKDNQLLLSSNRIGTAIAEMIVEKYQQSALGMQRIYYQDNPYICVTWFSSINNIWILDLIDVRTISNEASEILKPFLYIAIFSSLLSGFIAWIISRGIANTIRQLLQKIRAVVQGDFDAELSPVYKDEIGMLAIEFNEMSRQIQNLIDQVSEEKTKKKTAEIRTLQFEYDALQAKINPHFLYNTLECINSMAKINRQEEISQSIYLLGNYLRDTISNKRKFVTVKEEIENIQNYVKIQQVSCGDRLQMSLRVDESIEEALVPKLILQPLIENAYIHGIAPKVGKGTISVSVFCQGQNMKFVISDDGMGMDSEKIMSQLLEVEDKRGSKKISETKVGVISVHKRLQILYGESYGIHIDSEPGKGTIISFEIPIRFEGEMEDETI